jgi:hypothetical protein
VLGPANFGARRLSLGARGKPREAADEPFTKAKKMRFCRITEFNPVQHQTILKDWFAKA